MKNEDFREKLDEWHSELGVPILSYVSSIAGMQFPGEFNVSGFHKEVQELANEETSFWGIDICLRLKDRVDIFHSFLFEMGIFAKSVNLHNNFREPFNDVRFAKLQEDIITQFMQLLMSFGIDTKDLEATYLGNITFGRTKGRDKSLTRKYSFPEDKIAQKVLKIFGVKSYPMSSLANIDIHPVEGSLVGPRIEIGYKGMEIATPVFDCFKVQDGKLIPINYVGGYALGVERFKSALKNNKNFLSSVSKYSKLFAFFKSEFVSAEAELLQEDVLMIIFGIEILAEFDKIETISPGQKETFRQFKKRFSESCEHLGIANEFIKKLIRFYENEISYNRS